MAFEKHIKDKKAVVLGLDDVIYPEKDYLLQVYYLFSEFLSYTEQLDAPKILSYLKQEFEADGANQLFEKTARQFAIPDKYKANFNLLHQTARLPLKLLLYKNVLEFLQEVILERKQIFLLVDGDPVQQINKIKQTEWHGLEKYLKLYFSAEFASKPSLQSINYILNENNLLVSEVLMIGVNELDAIMAEKAMIEYLSVTKLL